MPPMSQTETGSYLPPALAGHDDRLFSDDAVALVHQTSRGYPRAINNLALRAPLPCKGFTSGIGIIRGSAYSTLMPNSYLG